MFSDTSEAATYWVIMRPESTPGKAVKKAGYKLGKDFMFAIDVAGSEMKNEAVKKGKDDYYFFWKTGRFLQPFPYPFAD